MDPSCVDFPVTLKATLFGVLLLTSMAADLVGTIRMVQSIIGKPTMRGRSPCSRAGGLVSKSF